MEFFSKITQTVKSGMINIVRSAITIKAIAVVCIAGVLYTGVEWSLELIRGENNPQTVYEEMDVDDFSDLIEIKGNEETGYYFAFKEGSDEKLKKAAERLDYSVNNSTIKVEELKKMIQAEVVSSYPNLGGKIGQRDDTTETYSFNTLNDMLIIGDDIVAQMKEKSLASRSILYGVKESKPSNWLKDTDEVNGIRTLAGLPTNSSNIKAVVVILGSNITSSDYENESERMKYDDGVLANLHEKYPDKKIFLIKIPVPENVDEETKKAIDNFNKEIEAYKEERNYITFIDATNGVKISDVKDISETELNKLINNMTSEIKKIKFQREKEDFEDDGTGFQGAIKIRRVSPDKNIGDMNKELGAVFTSYGEYTTGSQNQSNQNTNNNTQNQDGTQNGENQENNQEGQTQENQQNTEGQNEENTEQTTNTKVIVLDPGHGASMSRWTADDYRANGFIQNSSEQWGEYRHWKSGTYGQECEGSDCNGNNEVPNGGEWYNALSGQRDVEPEVNLANALAAKKYLEEMGYTVKMTRTDNSTHPSFAQRSQYCFPNNDTTQNPDAELYVCIHSNAGGGNGSAYISLADGHYDQKYIESDFVSESNNAGKAINERIVNETSLGSYSGGEIDFEPDLIAFHKNPCPTAYLEIGFFDNASDLDKLNSESDKIGKAIAEGIDDYFEHPQGMTSGSVGTGSGTGTEKVNTYSGIKSKVKDLSYVPETTEELTYVTKEVFDEYIKSDDEGERLKALDHFTLDENMKLIVASWSYNENSYPQITVKKSSPINYKTAMSKYLMPFEYLTSFLVDTLDPDFVMDLADLALNSEFIIAIEDNVTTRQTTTTNYTRESKDYDWQRGDSTTGSITESCSISVELTYADAWFVRAEKESSFSTASLRSIGGNGKILTGKQGDSLGTFHITGYDSCQECSGNWGSQTSTGREAIPNRTIAVDPSVIPYDTKVIIDGKIYVAEDCGGAIKGNRIDVYVENHAQANAITGDKEVFLAEEVKEEDTKFQEASVSNSLIDNATTIAKGKVEVKETSTTTYGGDLAKTETTTSTVAVKYENGGSKITGKEENFASILDKNKNAKENLKPDWLFQVLDRNDRTRNMVDLTKYLIYKTTGTEYGVTEFDFSEYDLAKFKTMGSFGNFGDWDGTGTKEDFINAVAPYAVIDMEQHGIYASVTIAQAIIESGWGKDNIAIQYKNFFGMKASGKEANEFWNGDKVELNASEGGNSYFKVYDSLKNSVYDHGRNFHVVSTYSEHGVLDCIDQNLGPQEQLKRITESGYAVDKDGNITKPDDVRDYNVFLYEEFIQKYNLDKYDSMTSEDFIGEGNSEVIEIAMSKMGCDYVWGAHGPDTFDCSGFLEWVFRQAGITVGYTTEDYMDYEGTEHEVSFDELQPGDIMVIYNDENGGTGHCGMYIGNDQFIHCSGSVKISQLSERQSQARAFRHAFRFW